MLNSFKKYFWFPCLAGDPAHAWSACWIVQYQLVWKAMCHLSTGVSASLFPSVKQWGGGWRRGELDLMAPLGPLWLQPSTFLPLKSPALPHLGPAATTASLRAEMSREVQFAFLWVWKKTGDHTCWNGVLVNWGLTLQHGDNQVTLLPGAQGDLWGSLSRSTHTGRLFFPCSF